MTEANVPMLEPLAPVPEGVNTGVSAEEERDIDMKMNQEGMSAFEAEYRVIGLERACARRGLSLEEGKALLEMPKEEEAQVEREEKSTYPEGPVYKPHPKRPGPRIMTVGDANSGDPDLR